MEHGHDLHNIPVNPEKQEITMPSKIDPFQITNPQFLIIRILDHPGRLLQALSGLHKIFQQRLRGLGAFLPVYQITQIFGSSLVYRPIIN